MVDHDPGSSSLNAELEREHRNQRRAYAILIAAAVIGLVMLVLFGHKSG